MSSAVADPIVHVSVEIRRAYSDALSIQNACNPSGVAISFGRVMQTVCDDLSRCGPPNGGSSLKSRHPVFVLFVSKLNDMAGLGVSDTDKYGLAYRFAEKVAQGVLTVDSDAYCEALAAYFREWDALVAGSLARMGWDSV